VAITRESGTSIAGIRWLAIVVTGLATGLGGAVYSLADIHTFTENMTNGAGYLALAAVIFGGWNIGRTIAACLLFGAATALLAALTLAYASTYHDHAIKPLMPALRSNWLTFHVLTVFLGYGGFGVAFASSAGYLITANRRTELADAFDTATAKTISFGFLFLTIGIIAGAVWANSAWGTYWSWDPKETWSLITWFIYAVFLHCRFMRGWKGKRAAWISVLGFASVIFTYLGVNYLLSGLHSYANA